MFTEVVFTVAKTYGSWGRKESDTNEQLNWLTWKQPRCPATDEWIKKLSIYIEILLSHKNKWNNAIYSNMDGPRDYHTKWSKPDRERQISYDIAYL